MVLGVFAGRFVIRVQIKDKLSILLRRKILRLFPRILALNSDCHKYSNSMNRCKILRLHITYCFKKGKKNQYCINNQSTNKIKIVRSSRPGYLLKSFMNPKKLTD